MTTPTENPRPDFMDLWDFRDPAATEAKFRDQLPAIRAAGDVSTLVQLLTQIARCEGLQRRLDDAHRTLDEAHALLADADLPVARLRYLLERGRAFDSARHAPGTKQPDKARPLYTEAFELGRERGFHRLALDASHMLGIIEPPDLALEWNLRSIELAEQTTDDGARGWLGPLYNNTGWTHHEAGRFDAALDMFGKSLAYRQSQNQPVEVCIAKWSVARCLRSLGRNDEALTMQRALIDEWIEAGKEEVGYVSEELGNCLWELGQRDEARRWFARAHERLSANEAWLLTDEADRMARLKRLAEGADE
ncbi:MAG: hypothetical protein AB7K09_00500 [Planctomycetota bacterium]